MLMPVYDSNQLRGSKSMAVKKHSKVTLVHK